MNPPFASPHQASFAANRIGEVASFARRLAKYLEHEKDEVTLYAVDADIVQMFLSPSENRSYGAVLRYQQHARKDINNTFGGMEERLVEFIAILIFFQLQEQPLILLPSFSQELGKSLNKIFEKTKATQEQISTTLDSIKYELKKNANSNFSAAQGQLNSTDSADQKDKKVTELINSIQRQIFVTGPVNELLRFDALSGHAPKLCHVDRFQFCDDKGMPIYLPSPLNQNGVNFIPPVQKLIERIFPQLKGLSATLSPAKIFTLRSDAQAISHLAWVNDLLARDKYFSKTESGIKRVKKINLITGSYLIPVALENLGLSHISEAVVNPLAFLGHPKMHAYLDKSPNQQSTENQSEMSLGLNSTKALLDFFDALMTSFRESTIDQDTYLQKITETATRLSGLISGWSSQQLVDQKGIFSAIDEAAEELKRAGSNLDQLSSYLDDMSSRTFSGFARSSSMLSITVMQGSSEELVKRNIPPVKFGHFEIAKTVCESLYMLGDSSTGMKSATKQLTHEKIKQLNKEDPTSYTEFICYALWALVHRNLALANGCVNVAYSRVPDEVSQDASSLTRFIRGEEALYLMAHIRKLTARNPTHLNEAEEYVAAAKNVLKAANGGLPQEFPDTDIRFEAEGFSIECHRIYFQAFGSLGRKGKVEARAPGINDLVELAVKGRELLKKVSKSSSKDYLTDYVRQVLLVNLVQLGLLCIYGPTRRQERDSDDVEVFDRQKELAENLSTQFKEDARQLLEHYRYLKQKVDAHLSASHLSECVAIVGALAFLKEKQKLPRLMHSGIVAEIDSLRFSYLDKIYHRLM
jgi:hypothetical protein